MQKMDETNADQLIILLSRCRTLINKGCLTLQGLNLSEKLHVFLAECNEIVCKSPMEIVYLCLTQIITCIKNMERTINSEKLEGTSISNARQHFLERILWCLDRLRATIRILKSKGSPLAMLSEDNTFVDLMDMALDQLMPYTTYIDGDKTDENCDVRSSESHSKAIVDSKEIRANIDLILSHTLAFANVALKQDKKALSALCQKVLRECIAFEEECAETSQTDSNRKIKSISLENALYQLEDYINESLLRLVFSCFLDFNKLSVDKLRSVIMAKHPDDPELDGLIADFDVNIDRTTQIGMFAIAFASNVRIKTIVRSCLASFEALDSCIIPSLQAKVNSNLYAKILENHFNEEVSNFKQAIQEIIDSHAFTSCYYDLLGQAIKKNVKDYDKESLKDVTKMGEFLCDHFQMAVNQKEMRQHANRLEIFNKFSLMLRECQAILACSETENVQTQRIMKRFKILHSIVRKFMDELGGKSSHSHPLNASTSSQVFIMSDELSDSQRMFASIGISPSICSILYNNTPKRNERNRQRLASDSLKANYSKLPLVSPTAAPLPAPLPQIPIALQHPSGVNPMFTKSVKNNVPGLHMNRLSIRRKESLRKAMFKRQKSNETEELYGIYKNSSGSLQISEILDQLTRFNSSFTESVLDKSFISK
ncbi:serendipity locus protein alpha isoform X2 [Stomoxys calcitrans]|uniref:serendipity locus protein alpha isoform X2 n=1 Tax=Stomoxys calcitrans TaxID=35570 RepID=UPI0027E27247|nr:serendipity locus protein alpha isoform X2 [Stomoxys calcitrans]